MARKKEGLKFNMIARHIKSRKKLVRLCRKLNLPFKGKRACLLDNILEEPISVLRAAIMELREIDLETKKSKL